MNNFKGKSILYICCAIIFSVTSCINAEVNYYKISIHCRKTNVKLKLISKDTSLVYKGEFYTKTDLFFKWEYEYGFESAIFEFDSLIVYKIENEQIIDSLLFGKSNLSRRNLLLPQNYKKRVSSSFDNSDGTRYNHIDYNYIISEDYFASDDYVNPLLD